MFVENFEIFGKEILLNLVNKNKRDFRLGNKRKLTPTQV